MKTILILLISYTTFCWAAQQTEELSPFFVYYLDYQSNASCNYLSINISIIALQKAFPNSKTIVYLRIADSSLIDDNISLKIKSKNIFFLTPEISDLVEKNLNITSFPTLIVRNFNGNELMRFTGLSFQSISPKIISNKVKKMKISGSITINYPIGVPNTQSISSIEDSVFYIDMTKNEIGVFNIQSGDSICTIKPDSNLINFSLDLLNKNDIEWINDRMYPISNYKCVIPFDKENMLCLTTNVSNVSSDTSFVTENKSVTTNICKLIKTRNIIAHIKDGIITKIEQFNDENISYHHIKRMTNNLFGASISMLNKSKYINNQKLLDSAYVFIQSDNIRFENPKFLISYSDILKAYNLDSINLYTLGLIDYHLKNDSYYYLNPYMGVFFAYSESQNSIKKFETKGLLSELFKKEQIDSINSDFEYFLMEWFIDEDYINILILPRNKYKFTQFIAVSKYNLNGEFINETYYSYPKDDKIFRAHLFGSREKKSTYLMIQSKLLKWQLMEIN